MAFISDQSCEYLKSELNLFSVPTTHLLYVPLQRKKFDTIEINIMTDMGEPVLFVD